MVALNVLSAMRAVYLLRFVSYCIAFAFLPGQVAAQVMPVVPSSFASEHLIYLTKRATYTIDIIKNDISVIADHYEEEYYLTAQGAKYSGTSLYYSSFTNLLSYSAYTLLPDGKKVYNPLTLENLPSRDIESPGVFYNDLKAKSVDFPQVNKGSITVLSYKEQELDPHLLTPFFFASGVPVLKSEIIIRVNTAIDFDYQLMNVNNPSITKTVKGKYIEYRIALENLEGIDSDEGAPSMRYSAPQLLFMIKSFQNKSGKVQYAGTQENLYNWLYTFIKDLPSKKGAEVKRITDSIVGDISDPELKSKAIFYWVQDNVRYIAFEDGYEGFIPRASETVIQRRYGDCKDMANLLVDMHQQAGVQAYHVWIGSRDLPYKVSTVPNSCNFNHMIAVVQLDNQYHFLDATGKYQPWAIPTDMIQGKEGLIAKGVNAFDIQVVPTMPATFSLQSDTLSFTYVNGVLKGKGSSTLNGYGAIDMAHKLNRYNKQDYEDFIKRSVSVGNNKCKVPSYQVLKAEDRDSPTTLLYTLELPDYARNLENELYVNMHFQKHYNANTIDTAFRKVPVENDHKYRIEDVSKFEIPAGYELTFLPANKNFSKGDYSFTSEYSYDTKTRTVILKRSYTMDTLIMTTDSFVTWNEMIKALGTTYKENVTLVKK